MYNIYIKFLLMYYEYVIKHIWLYIWYIWYDIYDIYDDIYDIINRTYVHISYFNIFLKLGYISRSSSSA